MSEKFRNRYRIESTRLKHWDYGSNGAYFITICTKNRIHYFGGVIETQNFVSPQQPITETKGLVSPQLQLSEIGKIADQHWLSIPEHFPFVKLGNHVIMPNHVHGIIIIDKTMGMETGTGAGAVETQNIASLRQQHPNKFGPQSKNLASIIRGYKSSVKSYATTNLIDFVWQPLFHDHIIRDINSYQRISDYILNNPKNWKEDRFHK